jgi:hypothetical protein
MRATNEESGFEAFVGAGIGLPRLMCTGGSVKGVLRLWRLRGRAAARQHGLAAHEAALEALDAPGRRLRVALGEDDAGRRAQDDTCRDDREEAAIPPLEPPPQS